MASKSRQANERKHIKILLELPNEFTFQLTFTIVDRCPKLSIKIPNPGVNAPVTNHIIATILAAILSLLSTSASHYSVK